jgi:hypothetical protein
MSSELKAVPGKVLLAGEKNTRSGTLITGRPNSEDPFSTLVLHIPRDREQQSKIVPATFFPEGTSRESARTAVFSGGRTPSLALVRAINVDPDTSKDRPVEATETLVAIEAVRDRYEEEGPLLFGEIALANLKNRLQIIVGTNSDSLVIRKAEELQLLISKDNDNSPGKKRPRGAKV